MILRAEDSLREGRLGDALSQLQDEVRDRPADSKLRVFLFQLLAITAQWKRAATQLEVVRDLDASGLPMVQAYREALQCEVFREEVFEGRRSPLIFGEPESWMARMVEAVRLDAEGRFAEAGQLRSQALEEAAPSPGSIDGKVHEWIADADLRLGPLLEMIVNGRYYWVPFQRIRTLKFEPPEDLRDLVWQPTQVTWASD